MKYSQKVAAVKSRIRRLPKLAEEALYAERKRDAESLIRNWQEGISKDQFHLTRLASRTVSEKRRKGYPRPKTPLYGEGRKEDTFLNGLRAVKISHGYKVEMKDAPHRGGKVSLKVLYFVHEFGATIRNGAAIIRIPARPALLKAYTRVVKEIKKKDPNKEIVRALSEYLKTGKDGTIRRINGRPFNR